MSGVDDLRTAIDAAVAPMTLDDGDIERTTSRVMAVLADPVLLRAVLEATGSEVEERWEMYDEKGDRVYHRRILVLRVRDDAHPDRRLVVRPRSEAGDA